MLFIVSFRTHATQLLIQNVQNSRSVSIMWWFVLIFSVLFVSENSANKLKVSIYYESLCPDSVAFFKTQLHPFYATADNITVDLIPFGKASATKENEKWNFTCQHGAAECYGNKAHACAIDLASETNSTEFVICAMLSGDASKDENLKACATENHISWKEIQKCMKSGKGDELLVSYGNRTTDVQPKIMFIPTIIFDDVYDAALQNIALANFKDVVEFLVQGRACTRCKSKNGGLNLYPASFMVALCLLSAIKVL